MKSHHRYFVLNARYLDWYERPVRGLLQARYALAPHICTLSLKGGKRKGSLALDQMFIRKDPDNISLILGETKGAKVIVTDPYSPTSLTLRQQAKEFKITSEGGNSMDRVDNWFETITKHIVRSPSLYAAV